MTSQNKAANAVTFVISDLGGSSGLGRARGALADYDMMKAKVLGADRTGQHLLGGLRVRVPELGL